MNYKWRENSNFFLIPWIQAIQLLMMVEFILRALLQMTQILETNIQHKMFNLHMDNLSMGNNILLRKGAHPIKIDFDKKLDPMQKTIHIFNIDAQRFRKIRNKNPRSCQLTSPDQSANLSLGRSADTG